MTSESKKDLCVNPTTNFCIPPEDSLSFPYWNSCQDTILLMKYCPKLLLWGIIANINKGGKNMAVRKRKSPSPFSLHLQFLIFFSVSLHHFLQTTLVVVPFSLFLLQKIKRCFSWEAMGRDLQAFMCTVWGERWDTWNSISFNCRFTTYRLPTCFLGIRGILMFKNEGWTWGMLSTSFSLAREQVRI